MLNQIWHILTELSPWLLLGAAVAGLMHLLVPAGRLQQLLRGPGSLLASVIVGIPLPLCSCSVIPVGVGLRKEGASRGGTTSEEEEKRQVSPVVISVLHSIYYFSKLGDTPSVSKSTTFLLTHTSSGTKKNKDDRDFYYFCAGTSISSEKTER